MDAIPSVRLNNGVEMPRLGLGTWDVGQDAVEAALEVGYRSVDTATIYRNEADVGRAIAGSGIPREDLFVTTKVWEADQGFDSTLRAFEASRALLAIEVVDLYLIHWPAPAQDRYVDTWRALEQLLANGDVRAIGVSNFHPDQLDRLARETDTVPAVNQIELHPHLPQRELRAYHGAHGIATEAYSPLDQAGTVLRDPVVVELAERYERTPAQIVLRWSVELGNIVIPRSSNRERLQENFRIFDFELDSGDVDAASALERDPA
jgi:2,5-diketo-D-gluconate reductase A